MSWHKNLEQIAARAAEITQEPMEEITNEGDLMESANGHSSVEVPITEEITLRGVQLGAVPVEDGGRILQIIDPMRARVILIPVPADVARTLGQALITTLEVAGPGDVPTSGPGWPD